MGAVLFHLFMVVVGTVGAAMGLLTMGRVCGELVLDSPWPSLPS